MTSERAAAIPSLGVDDGQRLSAGGSSASEGYVWQARRADMRIALGAVRRGPVAGCLPSDEVVRRASAMQIVRSVSRSPSAGFSPHHAGGEGVSISVTYAKLLIPEEAAPQFRNDCAPSNGMMPPPDSEMIAPPITE